VKERQEWLGLEQQELQELQEFEKKRRKVRKGMKMLLLAWRFLVWGFWELKGLELESGFFFFASLLLSSSYNSWIFFRIQPRGLRIFFPTLFFCQFFCLTFFHG
jgi:hypothetical protein